MEISNECYVVEQGILIYMSDKNQATLPDIEEVIPIRDERELQKSLDSLVDEGFLYFAQNKYATYTITDKGYDIGQCLNRQEVENGYPTIKRIAARVLYNIPEINKKYKLKEIEDILIHNGKDFLAELKRLEEAAS